MQVSINRTEHNSHFTIISNVPLRSGMSMQAMGLLCFMLSCSDTYEFSERGLCTSFSNGRDAIRTALKELEDNGYLVRSQNREDGKFVSWDWQVNELPRLENPTSVNPPKEVPTPKIENISNEPTKDNMQSQCDSRYSSFELIENVLECEAPAKMTNKDEVDWESLEPLPGPTEDEVYHFLEDNSPEFCEIMVCEDWLSWYDAQERRGWRDKDGRPIRSWQGMLRGFNRKYKADLERSIRNHERRRATQSDIIRHIEYGRRVSILKAI